MVDNKPKVSVCVITYNHEKYIRQCLQSIVDQVTDFNFEVIVGEDCSIDATRKIVLEYANKYPDVVKPILHDNNVGGTKNILIVHEHAVGEYIAHIDGDDFMLPGKLQIQADALDNNPDCSMCVHDMRLLDDRNQSYRKSWSRVIPRKSNVEFFLMNLSFFMHSSKMYRSECRKDFDSSADEIIDCYFHVHHALRGSILYLNKTLGVYRVNVGVSTVKGEIDRKYLIPNPKVIALHLESIDYASRSGVNIELINKSKAMAYFMASYRHLMAHDFKTFKLLIDKSYKTAKLNNIQFLFRFLSNVPIVLFLIVRMRAWIREIV